LNITVCDFRQRKTDFWAVLW